MAEATAQPTKKETRWLSTLSKGGKPVEYVNDARGILVTHLGMIMSQSRSRRPDELNLSADDIIDTLNNSLDSNCTYKYNVPGSKKTNFKKSFDRMLHEWVVARLIEQQMSKWIVYERELAVT